MPRRGGGRRTVEAGGACWSGLGRGRATRKDGRPGMGELSIAAEGCGCRRKEEIREGGEGLLWRRREEGVCRSWAGPTRDLKKKEKRRRGRGWWAGLEEKKESRKERKDKEEGKKERKKKKEEKLK